MLLIKKNIFLIVVSLFFSTHSSAMTNEANEGGTTKKRVIHTERETDMTTQLTNASLFRRLHVRGNPLVLVNIWDAGSAQSVMEQGAKAVATSSWAVAASGGLEDGEHLPFETALQNLKRIVTRVSLPVTFDFEGGYSDETSDLQCNVRQVIGAGAVGINFEDQIVGGEGLYSIEAQSERIAAIRGVATQEGIPLFINARTDLFFKTSEHTDGLIDEAIRRASAYAAAGADGFFVPGLSNESHIQRLCASSPLPVNVMVLSESPSPSQFGALGVARVSYGPFPYLKAIEALKTITAKILH